MIRNLLARVEIVDAGEEETVEEDSFISGKTFVITGAVHNFKNRNEFKSFVENHGGKVAGSVSKNTDYLVTNTPDSGSAKNKKAAELGVAVITEDGFCQRAGM
jgi:DNA ligase (NAD+)